MVYAIVRSGGTQQKVAVGDVIELDRQGNDAGSTLTLPALLLVNGETVTTDAKALDAGCLDRRMQPPFWVSLAGPAP